MPQASDELRAKFPGHDDEALKVLEEHFTWDKPALWIIRRKDPNYVPTDREWEAIDYMCDEWDFGWSNKEINGKEEQPSS